jgi:hypothetical protein
LHRRRSSSPIDRGALIHQIVLPLAFRAAFMVSAREVGAFNRFANNGAIYWSAETGAWEVYGVIREAWETDHKGVKGPLGFPIAEQKNNT